MADNNKVVIIGANGTMGAGAGTVFAGAGYSVTMLARSPGKAKEGLTDAQNDARAEAIAERISLGAYDSDLARAVGEAAIVFESLAEDLPLKKEFFELIDQNRLPEAIIATGSSGLSIAEMARGRSDSFRRNFLGVHLFNPPHVIVGTEVIPGPDTDPAVVKNVVAMLT
ncbi:MAG TPA: 3-hydroxyacyl-CoA dehydrogenase NAD-binding domain-containing protein, partial [Candidatus Sulfotelmatobacter sp.]|nr:3-hydroxyacyl-CoA dehydrogenase NAD-binding domain-containing protein [Candidatus Sulfotelmatobacter sp.]